MIGPSAFADGKEVGYAGKGQLQYRIAFFVAEIESGIKCTSRQLETVARAIDRREVLRADSGGTNCNMDRHSRPFFQFINPPAM
jgi:hypothetical protein